MPIVEGAADMILRELPFHAVEESSDGRWYIIDGLRLMSVTTALQALGKRGLIGWAGKLAADQAFNVLPLMTVASRNPACEKTWSRCQHEAGPCAECQPCGECRDCVAKWVAAKHARESSRRADEGTRVHDVAEWWSYHGQIKDHDEDVAGYVKSFQQYTADYGITPDDVLLAEALLVHRDIGAAGPTDGITRFHAERTEAAAKLISRILTKRGQHVTWRKARKQKLTMDLMVDFKTREADEEDGPKLYPEHALQLAGYRHFPTVRVKNTDHEEPLQPTDGGLVVQMRPNGYTARPVVCDQVTYENGFLPALRLYQWITEHGNASVSSHTFVLAETANARARKAAQQAAEPDAPTAA